jgi:hypothetical protein
MQFLGVGICREHAPPIGVPWCCQPFHKQPKECWAGQVRSLPAQTSMGKDSHLSSWVVLVWSDGENIGYFFWGSLFFLNFISQKAKKEKNGSL